MISFLNNLSKLIKKKVIVSPHPKYKNKYLQNAFKTANKSTREMIDEADLIVFSTSGAIVDAVIKKKKIINFYSKLHQVYNYDFSRLFLLLIFLL